MRFKGKKIVISRKDTWSLDCILSPILAAGLKKFKEVVSEPDTCAGCPQGFCDEYITDETLGYLTDEGYTEAIKKWHEALDKMIYAFDSKEPEIPDGIFRDEVVPMIGSDITEVKIHITNQGLYDEYKRDIEEWEKRVKEGRELFSKHYSSLWW